VPCVPPISAPISTVSAKLVGELERAVRAARALDTSLELAIFVTDSAEAELAAIAPYLADRPGAVSACWCFTRTNRRHRLAGWNRRTLHWMEFCRVSLRQRQQRELLRTQPASTGRPAGDAISFGITPQIHAFDERSMAENLAPQAEAVRSAYAFSGAPVVVSPVTLRPRFNAVAQSDVTTVAGELPYAVDARQMSLFGAGWTLGSVKYLAEAGASSVTYYETTGWQGVIETDSGSLEPDLFPSRPGEVFPLYHVVVDLAELREAELVAVETSNPLAVEALALRDDGGLHLLLANLTPEDQHISLGPVARQHVMLRSLDDASAILAMTEPARSVRRPSPGTCRLA
jgi:hypothetical protein